MRMLESDTRVQFENGMAVPFWKWHRCGNLTADDRLAFWNPGGASAMRAQC